MKMREREREREIWDKINNMIEKKVLKNKLEIRMF